MTTKSMTNPLTPEERQQARLRCEQATPGECDLDGDCVECGNSMSTHEGDDPTPYCDHCAQEIAASRNETLSRAMAQLDAQEATITAQKDVIAELVKALDKIVEMNRQTAKDKYGDANKAESWNCVTVSRSALARARALENGAKHV